MADVKTDIEAALEAAASDETTDESSKSEETEETVVKATEEPESKGTKGKGAQGRIQDLLANAKTLETQIEELTGTVGSRDEEIGKLVDLLEMRDNDAKVVAKINELHGSDPRFKDLIETLDKAIRGEEVTFSDENGENSEGDKEGEAEVIAKAQALLREAQASTEDAIADQQADLILHKADILTDRYVAELPEEYNEEDVGILRTVLVDHIDWDAIEDNPDALNEIFADGFQSALTWYKTPKGAATVPSEDGEGDEAETSNEPAVTQERLDAYANQDWGKMKMVETPDGKEVQPEISDEDFTQSLAAAMKKQNVLNSR